MSIFQAASVVNITAGGTVIGLGASYLLLLLAIVKQVRSSPKPEFRLHKPPRSTSLLILLFALYAAVSVFCFPRIFKGVLFSSPKFGLVPLEWHFGFLTQFIYLTISISLYFVAAYRTTPTELARALNWYVGGAVLAACIAIYQYASMRTGLPFPTALLHSNPVYVIFEGYDINGFARVNSTFTEASAAAFTFASALAITVWELLGGSITIRKLVKTLLVFTGLFLTISTTGYVCLIFIGTVAGCYYFSAWSGNAQKRAAKLILAIPVVSCILIISAYRPAQESFSRLVHTVLLDKTNTSSYRDREQTNQYAYGTAAQTYWLGAGWGVCRASSIIPTVLGNVGIPGFTMLIICAVQPFLAMFRRSGIRGTIHGAVLFALATIFLYLVVAGPELNAPVLWLLLAVAARLSRASSRVFTYQQLVGGMHQRASSVTASRQTQVLPGSLQLSSEVQRCR